MKTTKKIFAAVLAVMMIALMIPFSASAAEPEYSAKYKLAVDAADTDKVGDYTFSFFKIAALDLTTGKYTTTISDTALENAVKGTYSADKSQQIIKACDDLYKADKTAFDTVLATTISFTPALTEATAKVKEPGLYYVYCTAKPAKVTGVNSSLAALPYFNGTDYVSVDQTEHNLADKVSTSPVTVDKTADKTYVGDNDKTVTYTLTASTAGSIDNKLTKYAIVDTMDDGLTFNENSVKVEYYNADNAPIKTLTNKGTDKDYSIVENYAYKKDGKDATATFAVVLTDKALTSEDFYNAKTVVVTYEANVNENASLGTPMPNTDGLVYGNDSDTNFEPGKTSPNVYTYGVKVVKVDGNNTSKKLAGATFQIFTDEACTTPLTVGDDNKKVVAVTDNNGEATFVLEGTTTPFKFDATNDATKTNITYYAKEVAAPTGYNLNSSVFTVSIDTNSAYTFVGNTIKVGEKEITAVPNYPVTVPQTGGMGTMMFYVGGAALIACAGVLLFVLKRKKAAK